jgi:hypothetical protein
MKKMSKADIESK